MSEDWEQEAKDFARTFDGRPAKLVKRGAQSGPVYRPTFAAGTSHDINVMTFRYSAYEKANGLALADDVKVIFPDYGLTVEPTIDDHLEIDGKHYDIIDTFRTAPAGVTLFWKVQARSR